MLFLCLWSLILALLGVGAGRFLARRGVALNGTIANPQVQRAILLALAAAPLGVIGLILADKNNLIYPATRFFPLAPSLYLGAYALDLIVGLIVGAMGVLIGLEIFGRSDAQSRINLLASLAVIAIFASFLIHKTLPIGAGLGKPEIIDGRWVLQTTHYTCAPASIATLGRLTGKQPQLTEKEAALLAQTDRFGTSALEELRTLRKLGFQPQYRNDFTSEDLANLSSPAILHVREKIGRRVFPHAIVFVGVNPETQSIKVMNPLYGPMEKKYSELAGYWNGEIITLD